MNYRDYSSEDFAADAYFQKWVQNPDVNTIVFWEKWLVHNPDKRPVLQEAKKLLATFRFQENEYKEEFINKIWQNIEEKISADENVQPLYSSGNQPGVEFFTRFRKIAATLLLLIIAAATYYRLHAPALITQTTAYNELRTIQLPDSSLVTLNANSKLQYSESWDTRESREVWLTGEGFFQVRKKPASTASLPGIKFIVHVDLMDVEVLGTQFNVNTRRGKAQVVLNSGKVKLSSQIETGPKSIVMLPGELVECTSGKAGFIKKVVDPDLYSAWKKKQFVFKSTSVADIAAVLEDTYGWKIEIKDPSISQMTFTSTVPVNKPEVLLKLLAESFHVNIQKQGNKVVIGN